MRQCSGGVGTGAQANHDRKLSAPALGGIRAALARGRVRRYGPARSAGLAIAPSADGPLRASLRRYATTIRHIRFD
jgi:hypothetical protein